MPRERSTHRLGAICDSGFARETIRPLFEVARSGTFFLDEIGETTPATQVKLLRVLQQREVIPVGATEAIPIEARVLAATNRNLEEEIKRGSFRSDLYYRLNVIALHLPPLRQRQDDIQILANSFLERNALNRNEEPKTLHEDALDAMMAYQWPGNVRELENALERAVILTPGNVVQHSALPVRVTERRAEPLVSDRVPATPTLEAIERRTFSGC
ncbi:MAG: sigma 54-interacting transcriptional regulator [Gemmatimonadaceae bacterium]